MAVLCHHCWASACSVCGEWRLLPSCRAQASLHGGLPRCRAQAPACAGFSICGAWAQNLQQVDSRAEAQQQWHTGLVAPRPAGSSRTRDGTRVPCLGRKILYPWATRDAQQGVFFFFFAEWTTHARKGLPALLALQALSEFLECLCELCTQYPVLYSVLCHLTDVKLAVGWELAGRMAHCINRAFSADI